MCFFTPSNHRIPLSGAFKWLLTKAIIRLVIGRADLFHFLAGTAPRDALAAVRIFVTFPGKLIMKHLTYHKLLIYTFYVNFIKLVYLISIPLRVLGPVNVFFIALF